MNTADEWHSWVLGWCELMAPIKPRKARPKEVDIILDHEYWYYQVGRVVAVFTWLGLAGLLYIVLKT